MLGIRLKVDALSFGKSLEKKPGRVAKLLEAAARTARMQERCTLSKAEAQSIQGQHGQLNLMVGFTTGKPASLPFLPVQPDAPCVLSSLLLLPAGVRGRACAQAPVASQSVQATQLLLRPKLRCLPSAQRISRAPTRRATAVISLLALLSRQALHQLLCKHKARPVLSETRDSSGTCCAMLHMMAPSNYRGVIVDDVRPLGL